MGNDNNKELFILGKQTYWDALFFYQKADVIYQLSFSFCDRFIHLYKDRTRDQVIQAARSCKQNIVEGLADGVTSTEMQLKLLNVARASLKELREDFEDYIKSRHLHFYVKGEERFDKMLNYCRYHNKLCDYENFFKQWTDEEMCNYALTLCHMIDKMMMSFLKKLEQEFITQGGIRERMHRARTGYRNQQDERLKELEELVTRQSKAKIIGGTIKINGETAGYILSMNSFGEIKRNNFSKIKHIIVDEFITEKLDKTALENPKKVSSLIQSIGRLKDMKIYLLGNAIRFDDPILSRMGFKIDR